VVVEVLVAVVVEVLVVVVVEVLVVVAAEVLVVLLAAAMLALQPQLHPNQLRSLRPQPADAQFQRQDHKQL
jgi:hypothetical protein